MPPLDMSDIYFYCPSILLLPTQINNTCKIRNKHQGRERVECKLVKLLVSKVFYHFMEWLSEVEPALTHGAAK